MPTIKSRGEGVVAWVLIAVMTFLLFAVHWHENRDLPRKRITASMTLAAAAQAAGIDEDALVREVLAQSGADRDADLPRHLAIHLLAPTLAEVESALQSVRRNRTRLPLAVKLAVWGLWLVGVVLFVTALNKQPGPGLNAEPAPGEDAAPEAPPADTGDGDASDAAAKPN